MSRAPIRPPASRSSLALLCVLLSAPAAAKPTTPSGTAAAPAAVQRADIVLFGPRATNLDDATVAALSDAVEQALQGALPDARLAGPTVAASRLSTTGTPEAAAAALGAGQWITVRASRIEAVTEVALTRHRPGFRPVVVRAPLPPTEKLPAAAAGWVATLLAAPDPAPPPPLPADERTHDRLTWGLRAGGVWSFDESSQPLIDVAAEVHDRSGRWFVAGSLGGRLPVLDDVDRYWVAAARLRSGLYAGSGQPWPSLWLAIEPRMVVGDGGGQFGLMPVAGVGLDLGGPAHITLNAEVGYNLIDLDTALPAAPTEGDGGGVGPLEGPQPIELGLTIGVGW